MGNDPAQVVIDRIAYLLRQNGGAVLGGHPDYPAFEQP